MCRNEDLTKACGWSVSLFALLLVSGCGSASGEASRRAHAFDEVWGYVNESFYDDEFRGKDWRALGDKYRPRALGAASEKDFYAEINAMLFELGVSHIGVIPDEHPEWIGAPSAFANGELGLDIRVIGESIVVVDRDPVLGDAAPELRKGSVITRLNGRTLGDFLADVRKPPVSAVPELMSVTERVGRELFADPGSRVAVSYLDGTGSEREVVLKAHERGSAIPILDGVPPVYIDFESRVLEGYVGYIRFNSFHRSLLDQILRALEDHHDRPGLIIDLRGNVGGDFHVRRTLAERLINETSTVWRYSGRNGVDEVTLVPHSDAYGGPVVFLVDELSASSAEELSGAMQALGRARVVGSQTAGLVLVADVRRLEIGATLILPVAETSFANGYVPEGKGVVPDIVVPWSRASLLLDQDRQLDVALQLLRME